MENWKEQLDKLVFTTGSTHPEKPEVEAADRNTILPEEQVLRIWLDRKSRGGKSVTLVRGFVGNDDELKELARALKQHCGVGGTAKEGEIHIQGDQRQRVLQYLLEKGFRQTKRAGG
jgi:translation initiation factor 1